jgi:hypothetical protein
MASRLVVGTQLAVGVAQRPLAGVASRLVVGTQLAMGVAQRPAVAVASQLAAGVAQRPLAGEVSHPAVGVASHLVVGTLPAAGKARRAYRSEDTVRRWDSTRHYRWRIAWLSPSMKQKLRTLHSLTAHCMCNVSEGHDPAVPGDSASAIS